MIGYRGDGQRPKISFGLMTLGFFWLWTFNRNPHVLFRYFSHQGYILTWIYFLAIMMNWRSILNFPIRRLFELVLVIQVVITLIYWTVIHTPSVQSGRLSSSNIGWNIYIHTLPLVLLLFEIYLNRTRLLNFWTDTQYFYFFFVFPVNFAYSMLRKPVYPFLRYDSSLDMFKVLAGGVFLWLIQQISVFICNKLTSKVK